MNDTTETLTPPAAAAGMPGPVPFLDTLGANLSAVLWTLTERAAPMTNRTVLVVLPDADPGDAVTQAWYEAEQGCWFEHATGATLSPPTWWADLPSAPEPAGSETLWALHLQGPDGLEVDQVPAPSRGEAYAAAWLLNAAFERQAQARAQGSAPARAAVVRWEGTARQHRIQSVLFAEVLAVELRERG